MSTNATLRKCRPSVDSSPEGHIHDDGCRLRRRISYCLEGLVILQLTGAAPAAGRIPAARAPPAPPWNLFDRALARFRGDPAFLHGRVVVGLCSDHEVDVVTPVCGAHRTESATWGRYEEYSDRPLSAGRLPPGRRPRDHFLCNNAGKGDPMLRSWSPRGCARAEV